MSFLSNIGKFFGNIFGGNDEEEKRKRQQQQSAPAPAWRPPMKAPAASSSVNPSQNRQFTFPSPGNQQPANGLNLVLPGMTPNGKPGFPLLEKPTPAPVKSNVTAELERLTQENYAAAKKQREQGEGWFGRNFLNKGHIEQDATTSARSKAVSQYLEKNNWVKTPEVEEFMGGTKGLQDKHSAQLKKEGEDLEGFRKKATKVAQIAQYVPVTGSVLNIGLSQAERDARNRGDTGYADAIRDQRNQNEFDMTSAELDALPEDVRKKLQTIRNVSYGLAPLDFLGLGGLAKSTGTRALVKGGVQLAKEGAVDATTKLAIKELGIDTAKNLAKNTAVGTGVTLAGQQYLTGEMDPLQAIKTGTLVAGTGELFSPTQLRKGPKVNAAAIDDAAREVSPGLKSANPNQFDDAVAAGEREAREAVQNQPVQVDNEPAYLRKGAKEAEKAASAAAADAKAVELGAGPAPIDRPTFQHKADIQDVISQGDNELNDWLNANQGATPQQIDQARTSIQAQVAQRIADLQTARAGNAPEPEIAPRAAASEPVADTPAALEDISPTPPAPVTPAEGELPVETSAIATPGAAAGRAPELPTGPVPDQLPAAPNTYDQIVKQIGGSRDKKLKGAPMRDKIDLDELKTRATGVVDSMDDNTLVNSIASTSRDLLAHDPESFSLARASLDRLYQMGKDGKNELANQQVNDILDAMSQYASKNAQGLRVVQEQFDTMPLPMKVRYLVNKIDAANRDVPGYEPLSRDPRAATEIEGALTARLGRSQDIAEQISALENQINNAADAARNGEPQDIKGLVKELKAKRTELQQANGDVVKYFQDLVPGRTKAQKTLSDFPRMMMLSSFTGRVNDVITTAATVAEQTGTNITQGILSKGYNLIKGRGSVSDTTKGFGRLFGGLTEGTKKTIGEIKGNQYVEDIQKSLKGNEELRSGMRRARGPVGRTIQAATEYATRASEGVRDQRLYQLADQEASKLGLKGADRKAYAEARAAVPSRQMLTAADELHMTVNNLNDNPISRTLAAVGKALEGDNRFAKSGIGGLIKNQIIPFTSWLGGNVWNSVTDRNVIANTYKFARDVKRGDPEGAIRNLSKAINGTVQAYAIGFQLAKMGVLTDKDAEGYNDAGLYFHVGDRYIPVGFLGAFAPNIVLGKATHDAMNAPEGESSVKAFTDAVGNFAWHGLALGNVMGVESSLNRAYEAGTRPGGDAGDAAAVAGANVAGQYIPALGQDVNAVLNNYTNLNPTKEAAQTKVESDRILKSGEKSTAKDYPKSAVNQVINRIPFASQQLPRKPGVAADDLIDRTTRGNRDTEAGKTARADEKAKVDAQKDREKRGVPETAEAIEAKWQNGDFDLAIEGTKFRMDEARKKGELSKSDEAKFNKEIGRMEVMRDKGISYEDWQQYDKMDLSDWRKLGDPDEDTFNPDLYAKLWAIDEALKVKGASENSDDPSKNKFSAKKTKSGSGGGRGGSRSSAESRELARIRSNKLGEMPMLPKFNFSELEKPTKAGSVPVPQIQKLRSSNLVKKRKISVSRA